MGGSQCYTSSPAGVRHSVCVLTGAPGGGPEENHPVLQQRTGASGQQPVHPQTQSGPH